MIQQTDSTIHEQYLTFVIADEEYAVGILRVKEIIAYDALTRVPKTPRFIRGVINLRGSVVPVVDLAMKFELADAVISKSSCIVIVEIDLDGMNTVIGLLVDSVRQVIDLAPADIEVPPRFGTTLSATFITGMARSGKKFVLILDIDRVLAADEVVTALVATETTLVTGDTALLPNETTPVEAQVTA